MAALSCRPISCKDWSGETPGTSCTAAGRQTDGQRHVSVRGTGWLTLWVLISQPELILPQCTAQRTRRRAEVEQTQELRFHRHSLTHHFLSLWQWGCVWLVVYLFIKTQSNLLKQIFLQTQSQTFYLLIIIIHVYRMFLHSNVENIQPAEDDMIILNVSACSQTICFKFI